MASSQSINVFNNKYSVDAILCMDRPEVRQLIENIHQQPTAHGVSKDDTERCRIPLGDFLDFDFGDDGRRLRNPALYTDKNGNMTSITYNRHNISFEAYTPYDSLVFGLSFLEIPLYATKEKFFFPLTISVAAMLRTLAGQTKVPKRLCIVFGRSNSMFMSTDADYQISTTIFNAGDGGKDWIRRQKWQWMYDQTHHRVGYGHPDKCYDDPDGTEPRSRKLGHCAETDALIIKLLSTSRPKDVAGFAIKTDTLKEKTYGQIIENVQKHVDDPCDNCQHDIIERLGADIAQFQARSNGNFFRFT